MDSSLEKHYLETVQTLRDDPGDEQAGEALVVWGDALQGAGDPRGDLIALDQAYQRARRRLPHGRKELRRLAAAIDAHVGRHADVLLGPAALLRAASRRRILHIEWSGGFAELIALDARYHDRFGLPPLGDMIGRILRSPASRFLRRLRIRVRTLKDQAEALRRIASGPTAGPGARPGGVGDPCLEELIIGGQLRPQGLVQDNRSWSFSIDIGGRPEGARVATDTVDTLWKRFGNLHCLALFDEIVPVMPRVKRVDRHGLKKGGAALGRALWTQDPAVRRAGLARIAGLGASAERFMSSFAFLLARPFRARHLEIIECASALGPHARWLLPALLRTNERAARDERALAESNHDGRHKDDLLQLEMIRQLARAVIAGLERERYQ